MDVRPADDKKATDNITDIDEKVTAKFLEDMRTSRMFSSVDFPALRDKGALILKGEIKRFYWKTNHNPMMLLGITSYEIKTVVDLKAQAVDSRTGNVLAEYDKTSTKKDSGTLYTSRSGESGADLAEAFRDVSKQIKEAIANDILKGKMKSPQT